MDRFYRRTFESEDLVYYRVKYKQTDLYIASQTDKSEFSLAFVKNIRSSLEAYIASDPVFESTITPYEPRKDCPDIAREMSEAAKKCDVGPMAAVAGAIAEKLARYLHFSCENVIVENGGDIFMISSQKRIVSVYAVNNTLNQNLRLEIAAQDTPISVCTSSATYGHSLSLGGADSVTVLSESGALADAAATALCNMVKSEKDITGAIERAVTIKGISGVVIVCNKKVGAWGNIKFV